MIVLLRAMSVAHGRAQRMNGLRTAVSVAIGAAGLVTAFTGWAAGWAAGVGAVWALIYAAGMSSWADGELRRAALLQEMFDVRLFGIPWNAVMAGDELPAYEVSRLSRRYAGRADALRDYYEIPALPNPVDILGCQQQNLGWGSRVRRRYANAVLAGVVGWAGAGVLVGVLAELDAGGLLVHWYVPSLGALLLGLDTYFGQRAIAAERERIYAQVKTRISQVAADPGGPGNRDALVSLARQVQDAMYRTRISRPRVPAWFFTRFAERDRVDFRQAMNELVAMITSK